MSFKAKDLSYDNTQPAFLRRLRGELAGDDSARHERPIPRNKRLKQDDEEDAPTYVLEDTNQSLTKAEYEAMVSGKDQDKAEGASEESEKPKDAGTEAQSKDNIAEVGKATKKRKVARVIGEEKDDDPKASKPSDAKVLKKAKKKGKPVKLSFGDQEEG